MAAATEQIALAKPLRPPGRLGLMGYLAAVRSNWLTAFGEEDFAKSVIEQRVLWRRNYIVNDPAGVRHILLDNAAAYAKTPIARRLLEPGLGKGLITLEGETWRRHRRIVAPAFDPASVAAEAAQMVEAAAALSAEWERLPLGAALDMAPAMMRTALRVVGRALFSTDAAAIAEIVAAGAGRYQATIRPSLLDLLGLPQWLPRPGTARRARRVLGEFDAAIGALIAERRATPAENRKDLLWRLLAEKFSDRELRDHVATIFMAGHETTAVALTWTWYLLSQHPGAEAKLHAELDQVLHGRAPTAEDVPRLSYTRMVIDEALRLYPPAHTLSRQALAEDEVCGVRVRKGAILFIVPWLLHRHRNLWERPDAFEPERFLPERAAERPRFAYIPFGAGPRICVGAQFALTEAVLVLATLARHWRLRLIPGHPVEPHGLITLRAKHGMRMTVERRR